MIGRKCKYKSISLILAALLLLTSCGSETENAAPPEPEQAQSAVTEPNAGTGGDGSKGTVRSRPGRGE